MFSNPDRADGSQKRVNFIMTFWRCEYITLISEAVFTKCYRKWCKWRGYHFSDSKATDLYIDSIGYITTWPKNSNTKQIITTAVKELATTKVTLTVLRTEMDRLARHLLKYKTVWAMCGVENSFGPQLMAEIGK